MTKTNRLSLATTLAALAAIVALLAVLAMPANAADERKAAVVVADRGSGSISVIDVKSLAVETIDLPGEAEPMYVNHDTRNGIVWVGDRANSTVVAFDDDSYELLTEVPAGEGVFHQWIDTKKNRLWVVGDVANNVTVIDTKNRTKIAKIAMPEDIVAQGGKPHDVFVKGNHAFVSFVGLPDGAGMVVRYSTKTLEETGRIDTGGDPHLFVKAGKLFVASQDGSSVSRYKVSNLKMTASIEIPTAHGIFVTGKKEVLVTNISGGGTDALQEVSFNAKEVVDTVDTDFEVPHNVTVDNKRHAWVTHSGAEADQVSVIDLNNKGFGKVRTVTVGLNPFGLAFVR